MVSSTVRKRLRLPKLGQVGYVVTDLEKTMAYYKDTLGMRPWILLDAKPDPCIERGQEIHPRLKIAVTYSGPVQIELIQVTEGESFHQRHLEQSKGGVHHLGFMVRNIDKRLDDCQSAGLSVLHRGTISDVAYTVDYAYLDTVEEAGIILEFIQIRLPLIPLPMNSLVHNIACLVGPRTLLKGRVVK